MEYKFQKQPLIVSKEINPWCSVISHLLKENYLILNKNRTHHYILRIIPMSATISPLCYEPPFENLPRVYHHQKWERLDVQPNWGAVPPSRTGGPLTWNPLPLWKM